MRKKIALITLFACMAGLSFGQNITSLKLDSTEVPAGYLTAGKLLCVTPHASSFYEQTDLYEFLIGKVVKKEFQSFYKDGDRGSILYFEFADEFKAQKFLEGLLWGSGKKASKAEPDEYFAKGKILVIWSFELKSAMKDVSMKKVKQLLH